MVGMMLVNHTVLQTHSLDCVTLADTDNNDTAITSATTTVTTTLSDNNSTSTTELVTAYDGNGQEYECDASSGLRVCRCPVC